MAEWLIERGVGETRRLLVDGDRVLAARLRIDGEMHAGEVYPCKLVSRTQGVRRGTARTNAGIDILVDKLPPDCTEGSDLSVVITRAAIAERGRLKLPQGRVIDLEATPLPVHLGHAERDVARFPSGLWEEVWASASSGRSEFAGGEILCCVTPAMTVIDIDGDLPPRELALAAIPAIAQALKWFEIGGSVGIDFPTLQTKSDRRAVDQALETTLADWPHERTAMNGFGFVQLVARLSGPSLLHRFESSRVGLCARMALRKAERVDGHGSILMTVHPALKAKLTDNWLSDLSRRTGRAIQIKTDPALALEAPQAQIVT